MKVWDDRGNQLDSQFTVEGQGGSLSLVLESRGGPKEGPGARNPDYAVALEILLSRLARLGCVLTDALVDSADTRRANLSAEECRLYLRDRTYPIALAGVDGVASLRLELTGAQADAGRSGAGPNNRYRSGAFKRVRLRLAGLGPLTPEALTLLLATGLLDEPSAEPPGMEKPWEPSWGELDRYGRTGSRVEQSFLRDRLFGSAEAGTCALCGRLLPVELLVTAHIKPRAFCSREERMDWRNVVMAACALGCDALYERGYVAVAEDGKVLAHAPADLPPDLASHLAMLTGRTVLAPPDSLPYFVWHRRSRFRGEVSPSAGAASCER